MQITSVSYERLHSLPNFANERIGISALVEPTETADEVYCKLEAWVNAKLGVEPVRRVSEREQTLRENLEVHRRRVGELEAELAAYQDEELPY